MVYEMCSVMKAVRVVLSPDSENTPSNLWYKVFSELNGGKVVVKEKAYGLLIRGPKELVDNIVKKLRESDPNRIFVYEASPSIRGHHVFSGFLQLSGELTILPLISQALEGGVKGRTAVVSAKLIRCKYVEENIVALLIDYGDGKVKVRCPDMMFRGSHLCGTMRRCPYGEILYP